MRRCPGRLRPNALDIGMPDSSGNPLAGTLQLNRKALPLASTFLYRPLGCRHDAWWLYWLLRQEYQALTSTIYGTGFSQASINIATLRST